MTDRIVLTLPDERAMHGVAHLVMGGLAARLNLTIESLEDLQVALDGLLAEVEGEPTIAVGIEEGRLELTIGPFARDSLHRTLDDESGGKEVSLRRVLTTVSDGFEVLDREGSAWVALSKRVETVER
jgi:hypothetical protein